MKLSDLPGGLGTTGDADDPPETARVVRSGPKGIYVVPLGGDTRHPLGPCYGPSHEDVKTTDVVLLVHTDDGPWIAAINKAGGT